MIVRGMARTQKRRLVELYVHTSPWHELVCPPPPKPRRKLTPKTPSDDQPSRARESLVDTLLRSSKQFYEETAFANATDGVDPNGIAEFQDLMRSVRPTSNVPEYVLAIRAGEQPIIEDQELNAVTVFEELARTEAS